ncbi:hypothetical protein B0H14DRAFT_2233156, partial [Mycena olivaceomarginata]
NGEGCEQFWQLIRHLIPHLRISGHHNRLYILDAQIGHAQEASLFRLTEWICHRYRHNVKKRAGATEALRECGKPKTLLCKQSMMQCDMPLPPDPFIAGLMASILGSLIRRLASAKQDLGSKLVTCEKSSYENECVMRSEYLVGQEALKEAEETLQRKKEALGINEHEELEQLATSEYMRLHMNTRALKLQLRERLQARKFGMDLVEHAYHRLLNGESVKCREPMILKLVTEYNKLCTQIAKLIRDGQAPSGSMAPTSIPPKRLWQVDIDDAVFQDMGLDNRDNDNSQPLPWLCDKNMHAGIKALLELERCDEE